MEIGQTSISASRHHPHNLSSLNSRGFLMLLESEQILVLIVDIQIVQVAR